MSLIRAIVPLLCRAAPEMFVNPIPQHAGGVFRVPEPDFFPALHAQSVRAVRLLHDLGPVVDFHDTELGMLQDDARAIAHLSKLPCVAIARLTARRTAA